MWWQGADQSFSIDPDPNYQVADVLVDGSSVGTVTSYTFTEAVSTSTVTPDGAVSNGTGAATSSSASVTHTTGTGTDRLMLVGVSWNCGSTDITISSVTFTPNGGSATPLTEVKTQQYYWTGSPAVNNYRYTAIYSLLNPPSGVAGTVAVNFSDTVSNGIVVGAANFAGVDQTTPLGSPNGTTGTGTSSSGTPNPSLTLSGLTGNELVFDTVFIGVSNTSHTLTADAGQSALWNITDYSSSSSFNTRGAASTEQATGSSVTMSWMPGSYGSTATRWAIAAVPINPAPVSGTTYDLTMAVEPVGSGTTDPAIGGHTYAENAMVSLSATPNTGYVFDSWTGDADCEDGSVTMNANKICTANFVEAPPTGEVTLDGAVSSNTAASGSSLSFAHTSGTGTDRLMLVGGIVELRYDESNHLLGHVHA